MNLRFVLRGSLLALVAVLMALAGVLLFIQSRHQALQSIPPVAPPEPILAVPRGQLPVVPVGLVEWTRYGPGDYHPVGRGFFFRLPGGRVVGVTTAHSLSFNNTPPLRNIALGLGERTQLVGEFDTFLGEPGHARASEDMTVDYALLDVPLDLSLNPAQILDPDPRGLPQPGERVALYSLVNDQAHVFQGAVLSVDQQAVWAVMDDAFEPSGLSGSPFISLYTGKVIGMAIAATTRGGKVLLGLHPIGSLVAKAEAAQTFPKIVAYRR